MKRAVYTAVFGGYDTLRQTETPEEVDRICFTDDRDIEAPGWDVRIFPPNSGEHPRMTAKQFKCLPHKFLPDYEQTVWMDASIQLRDEFVASLFHCLAYAPLALSRHDFRNCIYEEAAASFPMEKYRGLPVLEQAAHYRQQGHPECGGLYAGGLIARRSLDPTIVKFGTRWMEECLRWTYQDQISLPVVLREFGIKPAVFGVLPRFGRMYGHNRSD